MSQTTPIEIFGIPQSNFVRAVRMVASEKGLAYAHHPVRPHTADALAVHPSASCQASGTARSVWANPKRSSPTPTG
jgi:hypothetical protein